MAKKTIGPYDIKLKFDTSDALKDAEQLEKEVHNMFEQGSGKQKSSVALGIERSMKDSLAKVNEAKKNLQSALSEKIELPEFTEEYETLYNQLNTVKQQFEELQKSSEAVRFTQVSEQLQKSEKFLESYRKMVKKAEDEQQKLLDTIASTDYSQYGEDSAIFQAQDLAELDDVERRLAEYHQELPQIEAEVKSLSSELAGNEGFKKFQEDSEDFGDQILELESHMKELDEEGKKFKVGVDKEKVDASTQALAKEEDKLKQQVVRYKELGNEAEKSGKKVVASTKKMSGGGAKFLKILKRGVLAFAAMALGVRGVMGIWNKLRGAIREGFKVLYDNDDAFKKQIDDIKNSFDEVKANLAAAFMPIVQMAIPYIQQLLGWVNTLLEKLSMFTAAIAGQDAYTKAIKRSGDAAKQANSQLSKLDELNVISSQDDWSVEQSPIDASALDTVGKLKDAFAQMIDKLKELVAVPFLDGLQFDKIIPKFDKLKETVQTLGTNLFSIFTDPRIIAAEENYVKTISATLGKVTGAGLDIGLELANLIFSGLNQFIEENKDAIAEKISGILGKESKFFENIGDISDAFREIFDGISENQDAIDTVSNLFGIIWDVFSTYADTQLQIILDLQTLATLPITENVDQWRLAIEKFFEVIKPLSDLAKKITDKVSELIQRITATVSTIVQFIAGIVAGVIGYLLDFWAVISPAFQAGVGYLQELWDDYVEPIVDDIISILADLGDIIVTVGTWLYENIIDPVMSWFNTYVVPVLMPILKEVFNIGVLGFKMIAATIKPVFDAIKLFVAMVKDMVHGDWKSAMENLGQFVITLAFGPITNTLKAVVSTFKNTWNNVWSIIENAKKLFTGFSTWWKSFWYNVERILVAQYDALWVDSSDLVKKLKYLFVNFLNGIISGFRDTVNQLVDMINSMSFTVPSWMPLIGGNSFSPSLRHVSWKGLTVPALASGTVIPPSMGDFIARLGDNNRETEVVSPLSTMREAMVEALQQTGLGGDITVNLVVDGRVLANTIVKQDDIARRSRGVGLFGT